MVSDEKSQTQTARGTQEVGGTVHDSYSPGGVQGASGSDESFDVGTRRANWPWKNSPLGILLGGILEQLFESHRHRLNETRECIEWYRREETKILEQIKKLEQLQELALSGEIQDDISQSPITTNEEE